MAVEIRMPAISPTTESSKLVCWRVEQGAAVREGDVLAELETDKAAMDIESPADGVLEKILIEGDTPDVLVGTIIGLIGEEREAAPAAASPEVRAAEAPASSPIAEEGGDEPPRRISPLARRLARELEVETEGLRGTGARGRIIAADVKAAAERKQAAPAPLVAEPASSPASGGLSGELPAGATITPHSSMRRTIARRLVEAKQIVPHYYLETKCEVDDLLALRRQLNEALSMSGSAVKITINDLVMKAFALSIAQTPGAKVTWTDEGLIHHESVDLGMAVSLENGLITPILRDAGRLSISALAGAARDAITRAREGALAPAEYSGGLAGISNLGMYGVTAFSAIINPPQSMNLAVGAVDTRLVLCDERPAERKFMRLTLSADHRAIDGALGAQILKRLKTLIETPLLITS